MTACQVQSVLTYVLYSSHSRVVVNLYVILNSGQVPRKT